MIPRCIVKRETCQKHAQTLQSRKLDQFTPVVKHKFKQTISSVVLRYPDATVPSGKCDNVISTGELYVQLEEEGTADPVFEIRCTMRKLYGSLSEVEIILEDPVVS